VLAPGDGLRRAVVEAAVAPTDEEDEEVTPIDGAEARVVRVDGRVDGEFRVLALADVDAAPEEPMAEIATDGPKVADCGADEDGEARGHGRSVTEGSDPALSPAYSLASTAQLLQHREPFRILRLQLQRRHRFSLR